MLKTRSIPLLFIVILFISIMGCSKKEYIHFDGYYSNQQAYNDVPIYFRFYPEGDVTASLPVTVNHIIQFNPKQLDKDDSKECTVRGKYTLNKNKVVFKLVDKNGTADFSGEFRENKLVLKAHSNINGKESENIYAFYKM
jgi:hypothetical protein